MWPFCQKRNWTFLLGPSCSVHPLTARTFLLGACRPFACCLLSHGSTRRARTMSQSVGEKFDEHLAYAHASPSTVLLLFEGTNRHDARCRSLTSKGLTSTTRTTTAATARMKILRNTSRSSWLDGRSMGLHSLCFGNSCADHASGRGDGEAKQGQRREEAARQGVIAKPFDVNSHAD